MRLSFDPALRPIPNGKTSRLRRDVGPIQFGRFDGRRESLSVDLAVEGSIALLSIGGSVPDAPSFARSEPVRGHALAVPLDRPAIVDHRHGTGLSSGFALRWRRIHQMAGTYVQPRPRVSPRQPWVWRLASIRLPYVAGLSGSSRTGLDVQRIVYRCDSRTSRSRCMTRCGPPLQALRTGAMGSRCWRCPNPHLVMTPSVSPTAWVPAPDGSHSPLSERLRWRALYSERTGCRSNQGRPVLGT